LIAERNAAEGSKAVLSAIGRVAASFLGLMLAAGFVVGSGTINFSFLSRQAESAWEGYVLGAVAIGVTGYNALGPMFVSWAWENGRRGFVVPAGALMWIVFVGFSLVCAVGFTASNRGAVTGSREAQAARLASASDNLKRAEQELAKQQKPVRAAAVIEEALHEIRQDRRWVSTKGCTEATVEASFEYCRRYFHVRQEHEAAAGYARLEQLRADYGAEILRLKAAGAARETDPQAGMVVRLSRGMLELAEAQLWLNSWAALVVEMGAALLPVVATGHGFSGGRRRRRQDGAKDAQGNECVAPARTALPAIRRLELAPDGTWQVQE
jgi:hypothetical protein